MDLKRYPLEKHEDERGLLVQNDYDFVSQEMKHFLLFFSKPGIVRGNHYHKRKREWFYIIKGEAELHLLDLKTKEKMVYRISGDKPELIEMGQNVAHAIKNIGSEEMIFLGIVNEKFDPDDPDTFYHKTI